MRPFRERVPVRAMRRGDDVAVLERAADADRARLLADRDVQEAGQLARAETLLDLLLEAADQEHLAQDVLEVGLRQACALFDLRHGPECTVPPVPLVDRWNHVERALDPGWTEATLSLAINDDAARSRAAALLGPAGPGVGKQADPLHRLDQGERDRTRSRAATSAADRPGRNRRTARARRDPRDRGRSRSNPTARSPRPGRPRSRSCRPTGATSSRRSSSTRARTSTAAPSSALPSIPSSRRDAPASASAAPARTDTAPPPGWSTAASAGSMRPGSRATSGSRGR